MNSQLNRNATVAIFILLMVNVYCLILTYRYSEIITQLLQQQDLNLRFDAISLWRRNLNQREILLLRYFTNLDHEQFEKAYTIANQNYAAAIDGFHDSPDIAVSFSALVTLENRIAVSATELSRILSSQEIDWVRGRELLGGIAMTKNLIELQLGTMEQDTQLEILKKRTTAQRTIKHLQQVIYGLTAILVTQCLLAIWVFFKFSRGLSSSKALALFPERNPNPILRLSLNGDVEYANPSAQNLLDRLFPAGTTTAKALFPPDLDERLKDLQLTRNAPVVLEYSIEDKYLECALLYLPDVESFYAYITDITQRKTSESELLYQAHHDSLTSLPNRRMLQNRLEFYLHKSTLDGEQTALLLLSLDRFQAISGSLGPKLGDDLLAKIATRLKIELEKSHDICKQSSIFRLENAIFAVLLYGFSNRSVINRIAGRFIKCMQNPVYIETKEYFTTLSIGVSIYPIDGTDTVTLLRNATSAMTRANHLGGNAECFYSLDMKRNTPENLSLENYLRHAITREELELYYQPQISIETKRVNGVEAVLRWNHPKRGIIMPDEFIPLAEETGMIIPIGEWTLHKACEQAHNWHEMGFNDLTMAVNISGRQFQQNTLPGLISRILQSSRLNPSKLELEITESIAMQNFVNPEAMLLKLKRLKVQLSLDDFGTGWSSLTYLKSFPIDKMKLDQSFVHNLTSDRFDTAICRALITLSRSLDITVLAEGVENQQQLDWMEKHGCDQVQGFFFSKPLTADAFIVYVRRRNGVHPRPKSLH